MKKINTLLRSTSIKTRLLIGFIFVPILVLSVFFCTYDIISKKMILEKNEQSSKKLLTIVAENFNLNVNKFEQQMDEIMSNDLIYRCITEIDTTTYSEKRVLYTELNSFINTKTHFLSNAYELAVYTKDGQLTYSKGYKNFKDETIHEYTKAAQVAEGRTVWFHTNIGSDGVIGLSRAMYDRSSGELMGYMFLALNENAFTSLFASDDVSEEAIIVVDNENRYLFGQYPMEEGTLVYQEDKLEFNDDFQTYLLNEKPVQDVAWKVVNMVNMKYILKELSSLRSAMLFYIAIILFVLYLIMTYIYRSFYDPLKNILTSMDELSDRNLNVKINDEGNDELHELSMNFNDLVERIQQLVKTVESEQEAKREAEIKMLQAQINPHFLFNTLNTLRYLAILNNDKPLSQGISALAKLLRNTITDSKELVDICDEVDNVKNYIIIQKLRYGNLFETDFSIDEDIKSCKIMKFLLQPIVENAILHGFVEDRNDQLLSIHIEKEETGILVEVRDNGVGFDQNDEPASVRNKKLSGIGMKNIEERIHLTYGTAYRMCIHSTLGQGTCVRLHLPLISGEEEPLCIE